MLGFSVNWDFSNKELIIISLGQKGHIVHVCVSVWLKYIQYTLGIIQIIF